MKLTVATDILDVNPLDDQATVKKAFKRLMLKVHPDKNPENPEWAHEATQVSCLPSPPLLPFVHTPTLVQNGNNAFSCFKAFWLLDNPDPELAAEFDEDEEGTHGFSEDDFGQDDDEAFFNMFFKSGWFLSRNGGRAFTMRMPSRAGDSEYVVKIEAPAEHYIPDENSVFASKKRADEREKQAWDEALNEWSPEALAQEELAGETRVSQIGGVVYEKIKDLKKLKQMCATRNRPVEFRVSLWRSGGGGSVKCINIYQMRGFRSNSSKTIYIFFI